MWRILKTEFSYTKDALVIAYMIALIFFIVAASVDSWGWDVFDYMSNTTATYFILMFILGSTTISEKRYRYYATLPVTPRQIAIVDGLYVTLVQLGMFLLWIFLLFFKGDRVTSETIWAMLAGNGFILSAITVFGIHYHLGFYGTKKYKRLNYGIFC